MASSCGSLTAAADILNVTHGAISRRVATVEHWAKLNIFERHGRGVRPTPDGQRLIAQIDYLLAQLEDAPLSRTFSPDLDVVRVGSVPSFARLWLLPHLDILEGQPADLRIEFEVDNRLMALSPSRLAVRLGRGDWPGVASVPLFFESLRPVATSDVIAQLGSNPPIDALLAHPLLHDASDDAWRLWLGIEALGRRPRDRIFPGYDLVLAAAGMGTGIALARWPYGRNYIKDKGLHFLADRSVRNHRAFHLVTAADGCSDAVKRLVARMQSVAAAEGDAWERQEQQGQTAVINAAACASDS